MTVDTVIAGGVATITLNRSEQMNALDRPTRDALTEAILAAGANGSVGAVVLTGSGRAFCAGQDLTAVHELEDCEDTVMHSYNPIAEAIVGLEVPVIAAVNGAAVGAGMGIALSCDVVLMSENASFACVFGTVALVPDTGTSWFLVHTLGYHLAWELAFTGRKVGAEEAQRLRLATEVVAPESLHDRAHDWAQRLAQGPRVSQAITKRLLRGAQENSLAESLRAEAIGQGIAGRHQDHLKRRAAFLAR